MRVRGAAHRLRVALLAGTALTFAALPAQAQIAQAWNGNVSTDWFNGANWDSTTAPVAGDSATLNTTTPNPAIIDGTAGGYSAVDLFGLNVGLSGTGSLTINNGASVTVTNNNLVIGGDLLGTFASANGTLVLDNAMLIVTGSPPGTGTIFIGASGTGSFTAQNGSVADTVDSYVGHFQGATGTATVDGSAWTNSGSNYVGNFGTGVFNLQGSGTVDVADDTIVGANTTGNGTINISGAGSAWTTAGLTILGGNLLTPVGGAGTINVSNGGSYIADGQLIVGLVGTGAVNITAGGQLTTNDSVYLGFTGGATGTVTVDGTGSVWTANGAVTIVGGNDGSLPVGGNGTINVLNGATFDSTAGDVVLGNDPSETSSGTVNVNGATWNAGGIYVGESGNGTLNITNAATVIADIVAAGDCDCSLGTINVSGGSTFTVTSDITLGFLGTGIMNVSGAGTAVTAGGDLYLGLSPDSTGTMNVSGPASVSARDFYVGYAGTGTVNALDGASITATGNLTIGVLPGANGTFNVSGAGSTLTVGDSVAVGNGGVGTGALNVFDGGAANVTNIVFNGDRIFVGAGSVISAGSYSAASDATTTIGLRGATSGQINLGAGTATLDGALVVSGHNQAAASYTLVTSGGLGGTTFSSVVYQDALQNPVLTYTPAGDVVLNVDLFVLAATPNLGANQKNVAQVIDNALAGGPLPPGFDDLFNLSGNALTNGLTQAAGLPGASTSQAGITSTNTFINTIFNTAFGSAIGGDEGAPLGYASQKKLSRAAAAYAAVTPRDRVPLTARWNMWATGYGGYSQVDGSASAGTATTTGRVWGIAAGAEYQFTPDTKAGFAVGGSTSNFSLDGGFGSGSADAFNLAVYGRHRMGPWYVAGALGYSLQAADTKRTVTILGTDVLEADFTAHVVTARIEGGYRLAMAPLAVTPYAALQSTTFFLPSYSERATAGLPTFALSYDSEAVTATRTELGAQLEKFVAMGEGIWTLRSKLAWAHDWNTDRQATATFQGLPGATFTVNGAEPAADAALVSLGSDYAWGYGWSIAANLDGEFSTTTASYTGRATLKYVW